jgi:delta 1-pyrroline-5-carboxylate dehydrogenase
VPPARQQYNSRSESTETRKKIIPHYISGKTVGSESGRTAPVFNPATGAQSVKVQLSSAADVRKAVLAARAAYLGWTRTTPLKRGRILNRFLHILEERTDELAAAITAERGKILSDAKGEIQRGMEVVEFATSAAQLLKGEITEKCRPGNRQPFAEAIPWSRGRDNTVQFSRHGADVDVSPRDCVRQLLHFEAVGARSVRLE